MIRDTRRATETRYERLRAAARARAEELTADSFGPTPVQLTGIGRTAMEAFRDQWANHPSRVVDWLWPEMMGHARRNHLSRLEVAVWSGETLCGLAWGRTGGTYCSVNYLEGSPDANHPLKGSVAVIVSGAAVAYATALNKEQVRLVDPLPEVVPLYERIGFTLATPANQSPYCVWELP